MHGVDGVQLRWATVPRMVVWLVDGSDTRLSCAFTKEDFLGSQAYTIVLLLISLFLNSLNRKIKRNYKVLIRRKTSKVTICRLGDEVAVRGVRGMHGSVRGLDHLLRTRVLRLQGG